MALKSVEIIFKRSLADVLRNLFVPKAKRFPRVATFTNMDSYDLMENGDVTLVWGSTYYTYPRRGIRRIKAVYEP